MVGIVGYMILSELDVSILRTGIMGVLVFGVKLFGRQYTVLLVSLLMTEILLLYEPALFGDIGFQLSALATVWMVFLKPLIPLKGFLLTILGQQLQHRATLPVMLSTFENYGLVLILVNTVVLWTIPTITVLVNLE